MRPITEHGNGAVLVVDDNLGIRTMLESRLEQLGLNPLAVASGEEALQVLTELGPPGVDLVLLDQEMPGCSGIEVLERLRARDPHLPVIMLTAHGSAALATEFMRVRPDGGPGGTDFLEKPIPREPLFGTVIRAAIKQGQLARRAATAEAEASRLNESRANDLQNFLNSLPYPAVQLDGSGRVTMANRAYAEPLFRGHTDIDCDYLDICLHQGPGPIAVDGIRAVLAGTSKDFSCRYIHWTGSQRRWFRLRANAVFGRNTGAIVAHFDITVEVETQERLNTLANHLPAAAVLFREQDGELRITFARGASLEQPNLSPERVEGRMVREVFPDPADHVRMERAYRQALAGERFEYEHRYGERVFRVHMQPVYDDTGNIFEGLCVTTDITKLKMAEEEAQKNARFAERVISTSNGICIFDIRKQKHVFTNREFERLIGWTKDDLNTLSASELWYLIHPDDWNNVSRHIEFLSETEDGTVVGFEFRIRHQLGGWRWLSTRDMIFDRDQDGAMIRFIRTVVDITERKQNEAERETLMRQMVGLLDNLSEGSLFIDNSCTIIKANPAAHDLFGFLPGQLVGVGAQVAIPNLSRERLAQINPLCANTAGCSQKVACLGRRTDGKEFPITMTLTSIDDEGVKLVMALVSDATAEQARLEAEARAKVAEESRQVGEALVLNVMHQIGNYLQGLLVSIRVSEKRYRLGDANVVGAIQDTIGIAKTMSDSFERMQDMMRIKAGRKPLDSARCIVKSIFIEAIDDASFLSADRDIVISHDHSDDVMYVDHGLMMEVMHNLISNAMKFCNKGDHVTLSANKASECDAIELRIADTGPGVPDDEKARIFTPLYRGHAVRDGQVPGSGVGLAIVRQIIKLHGGDIWVEDNNENKSKSNPRGGSVFLIRIPTPKSNDGASGESQ